VIKKELPRWRFPAVIRERRKRELEFALKHPEAPKFSPKVC
jgi:hypothetical protein